MTKPFIVTLLPSTDVDLGRWLLKHWEIDYKEHPHAPIFHILALWWYGFNKDDYPLYIDSNIKYPKIDSMVANLDKKAVPENRLIPDETTEKKLYDDVMALQYKFRYDMGSGTVNWAYYNLLPHKNLTWKSFTTGVPWWETLFLTFGYGIIKYLMFKGLSLNADVAEQGLEKVKAGFDECENLLKDGRKFLLGDRLTLVDLAFAASAAPMILANGYGGHLPKFEQVPKNMQDVISELRERPAGKYAQQLYDEYRK